MKNFNYVTNNEIAVDGLEPAISLMEVLIDNGYVVMLSKEEKLYIVNYIWSDTHSNRNSVVFNSREEFEDFLYNRIDNAEDEWYNNIRSGMV